ncbi:hypothetical protein [Caballeronia sp. ATUFL_M2_KS44]|uniref:hypothetical protein n=1 Tax=Caballeronia sp. ATUFL_M2_KS44 TaxID=2921767 RepID=UPI00202916FA|nr:hypothetical protein [Caballeronia sp. ATUFL_M2_KS44]
MNSETQKTEVASTAMPPAAPPSAIAINCNRSVRELLWYVTTRPALPDEDYPPLQWL